MLTFFIRFLLVYVGGVLLTLAQADTSLIKLAYLSETLTAKKLQSNLMPELVDEGLQGALLAIADNNTTGEFTGQRFQVAHIEHLTTSRVDNVVGELHDKGIQYIVANLSLETLQYIAKQAAIKNMLVFNASVENDDLRQVECMGNVFNMSPSYAMKADALAQFMLKKRWKKWLLVRGESAQDILYSNALKRSVKRFGLSIVKEKMWPHEHDSRKTTQSDIAVFTQESGYDVVVVADSSAFFGDYLLMNTWLPRPVSGTQGMVATAWHHKHERWGGVQIQKRFFKRANRWMTDIDYASWLAVRAIGEASTRTQSGESPVLKKYLLSEDFSLAGFKGVKLNFRLWNQQLRQPILLGIPNAMVAVLPYKEFLHPRTYLDTLGYDQSESNCQLNQPSE